MKLLEERIIQDGTIKPGGVLKVDNFLNHQIDTGLLYEMACEWKRLYVNCDINKILTIEEIKLIIKLFTKENKKILLP